VEQDCGQSNGDGLFVESVCNEVSGNV